MRNEPVTPGTIVVGVDGSDHAKRALVWAAEQAALEGRPLTVVHVVDGNDLPPPARAGSPGEQPQPVPEPLSTARAIVQDAVASAEASRPGLDVVGAPRLGDPRQQLVELSETAHMIVVGSRGRGPFAGILLGSVSVSVAKHAKCPVVVVRPGPHGVVKPGVLVGADSFVAVVPETDSSTPTVQDRER